MSIARSCVVPSVLGMPTGRERELETDVEHWMRRFVESQATFGLAARIQLNPGSGHC